MAYKQLRFRAAAREKILRGATELADAVRVTLGPKSKCVLIEKKFGSPIVCNEDAGLAEMESAVAAEIEEAVRFAETGPWEPIEDLLKGVYSAGVSSRIGDQ